MFPKPSRPPRKTARAAEPAVVADAPVERPADGPPPDVPGAGATSILGDMDLYLFNEGSHVRLHEKLGAHLRTVDGVDGAH
ncbi:MAG: hypothetical protein WD010_02965, partial [Nitriliruptor sp.]